jgi:hypothetical protein
MTEADHDLFGTHRDALTKGCPPGGPGGKENDEDPDHSIEVLGDRGGRGLPGRKP